MKWFLVVYILSAGEWIAADQKRVVQFHIIVGCFSSKSNAKKLIKELNNKGNKAHELDVHKNLHRISIGSFKDKIKAVHFKRKIKSQQNISSWILKK